VKTAREDAAGRSLWGAAFFGVKEGPAGALHLSGRGRPPKP